MHEIINQAITVFLGFFAIMNPIANTAVFVGLAGEESASQQRKVALKALSLSFFIILAFAILGKGIFHMFGITLPAFKITGGVLIFIIGTHMLGGESSKMHKTKEQESDIDIAVSPLAVPILAGPGTIATAINFSAAGGWVAIGITIAMFALLCLITYICFLSGERIVNLIGNSGLNIVTRLMGLILAVIGVQMLIEGIASAIHTFGH
jgi:multiple antibiotic resistance protein